MNAQNVIGLIEFGSAWGLTQYSLTGFTKWVAERLADADLRAEGHATAGYTNTPHGQGQAGWTFREPSGVLAEP